MERNYAKHMRQQRPHQGPYSANGSMKNSHSPPKESLSVVVIPCGHENKVNGPED